LKRAHELASQSIHIGTVLDVVRRAHLGVDVLRRLQGNAVAAIGFGPTECPYQITASGPYWRLRDYGGRNASASLLIVAAPIKRPYIWDLTPSTSAIRYCLQQHLHAYLLEWMAATRTTSNNGFNESTLAISNCIAAILAKSREAKPFLMGHSLGGTLATIYGASASETIRGLVLLGAPLCFQPAEGHFRDALVSLAPSDLPEAEPFSGSLLSLMSMVASPSTFIWSRLIDAAFSFTDPHAMDIHARIERWALDEVPLPGKLVRQIIEWLYRENRLCRGVLEVGGRTIGPSELSIPTLAVVNVTDEIAPLASVKPFIEAIPTGLARLIEYPGELGVCLQHLGILVGRQAHANVWPQIVSWLSSI
jgi:polyhydroxyalkanoate synthase subunit PhaC